MTCGTTDQTTENITASLIGRHNTIRDHEGCGTDMVRDQTDRYVLLIALMILAVSHLRDFVSQCSYSIYIKNRIYILYNRSQTLQTHTSIDILLSQLCVVVISIIIELGKYVVPDLHITVTVTAYCTAWFSTAIFFTTVIINF